MIYLLRLKTKFIVFICVNLCSSVDNFLKYFAPFRGQENKIFITSAFVYLILCPDFALLKMFFDRCRNYPRYFQILRFFQIRHDKHPEFVGFKTGNAKILDRLARNC